MSAEPTPLPAAAGSVLPPAIPDVLALPEAPPAVDDAPLVRIQLASVGSEAEAGAEKARLLRRYHDLLGELPTAVVRADLGPRGVVYRLQAGPLPQTQATIICERLKATRAGCLIYK